jgi:hypothetical protein
MAIDLTHEYLLPTKGLNPDTYFCRLLACRRRANARQAAPSYLVKDLDATSTTMKTSYDLDGRFERFMFLYLNLRTKENTKRALLKPFS